MQADAAKTMLIDDAASAFEVLYGLVVRDTQIRVLLGEPPPSRTAIVERARTAVNDFLRLHGTTSLPA